MESFAVVFTIAIFLIVTCAAKEYQIFCQHDLNSYYYKNTSKFYDWQIDNRLCTHLVLGSGIGVDDETGAVKIKNKDLVDKDLLHKGENLRYETVQKVLISVGGFEEDSGIFSRMAASESKRDEFVSSLAEFLLEGGYDGAQIDWRYPTQRGGHRRDKENFVTLLEELNLIFREHKFLLMVVVLGRTDQQTVDSYSTVRIAQAVDFINLMVDDEQDKYRKRLSYIAPLFGGTNSVAEAIMHWAGGNPHKLILNVPFFGRSYTMDKNQSAVGSPCKGPGLPAKNSGIAGFTTFNEYCIQASKWSKYFDKQAKVPYAIRGDQWLTYENSKSIWAKMHYLKKMELGGAIAWTIDADDHYGTCGIRYNLLKNIYSALGDPNRITTQAPTTEAEGLCPRDGFNRDKWECRYYYECRNGIRYDYQCIKGQYFDEDKGYCRPAKEVKCNTDFVIWRPGMPLYSYKNLPLNLKIVE